MTLGTWPSNLPPKRPPLPASLRPRAVGSAGGRVGILVPSMGSGFETHNPIPVGSLAITRRSLWEFAMPVRRVQEFDIGDFLSKTGLGKSILQYPAGGVIFYQGDPADAVFYLQKGRVKLTVVSKQGKGATVALLTEGDFLGEACIVSGHPQRTTSALATTACSVLRIERKAMLDTLHIEHTFSDLLVAFLIVRNSRIQAALVDQLFNSAEKRLARTLLQLTNFGKDDRVEPVLPKMSHAALAEIVGTTRPRVTYFMNRFRKLGFIDYNEGQNGGLEVHSTLLDVLLHE
jgi:CRP/FNR family cyclic AMP-dependent transcriptional regulator